MIPISARFRMAGLAVAVAFACSGQSQMNGHAAKRDDKALERSPLLVNVRQRLSLGPLSLNESVAIALAVNPTLAQAGENLAFAEGRVGEAKSAYMPTVSLSPGDQYILRLSTPFYAVQATMPLDISRLISAATAQAGFQEIQARLDVNRTRNEIVYRVEGAFYTALRARALESVAAENLSNTQARLNDARARYRARAVAYIDVVRAETDVAEAKKEQIQAQSSVDSALASLESAMGVEINSPIEISDRDAVVNPPGLPPVISGHTPTPDELPAPAPPDSSGIKLTPKMTLVTAKSTDLGPGFNAILAEALATRPEVYEADAGIKAAEQGVRLARRSDLPSLAMGVGYYDLRTQSGSRVNEPQAFIGINIPIYDGGLAKARVHEAQATVQSAITAKREAIDNVTLDVHQAFLAQTEAVDEVIAAAQALVQAHAAYDLALVRYNTGVASHAGISPLLELSDAQAALTQAEQNQVNALYDYNGALAQVNRAAGRFAYAGQAPNSR